MSAIINLKQKPSIIKVTEHCESVLSRKAIRLAVQDSICRYFQVSWDDITEKTRKANVVKKRHFSMAYYVDKKSILDMSLGDIGKLHSRSDELKPYDHSTVIAAAKRVEKDYEVYKGFRDEYNDFERYVDKSVGHFNLSI